MTDPSQETVYSFTDDLGGEVQVVEFDWKVAPNQEEVVRCTQIRRNRLGGSGVTHITFTSDSDESRQGLLAALGDAWGLDISTTPRRKPFVRDEVILIDDPEGMFHLVLGDEVEINGRTFVPVVPCGLHGEPHMSGFPTFIVVSRFHRQETPS